MSLGLKKSIPIMIAVAFLAGLWCGAAGAADTPKKGGTITIALNTDITHTDPHNSAQIDSNVLHHVLEGLAAYGKDLKIVPLLADSWDVSPDYKTYTFHLVKGKKFHNGQEMTAEDVKFSYDRLLDPKTKFPRREQWASVVDKIEALDKYTVQVQMKEGFAGFMDLVAEFAPFPAIVPKAETEKLEGVITHPIGTGPFKWVEWKPDRYVLMERFDDYLPRNEPRNGMGGGRIAYADKIKFVPIAEESVAIMALLNKEIDILQFFPMNYMKKYEKEYKNKGIVIDEETGLAWYEIYINCSDPVTGNLKFRQAMAYATDLDLVTQATVYEHGKANPSVLVPNSQYWTPYHKTWYKKDVAKAKELLKEAGYKGEEVVIDTNKKYIFMYRQSVALQSELAAVGINAKLNVLEWPVQLQKFYKKEFQIQSFGMGMLPDPASAYAYLKMTNFLDQSPELQAVLDEARKTADPDKRRELFEKAHKIHYENVPWIIFYNYNYLQAFQSYVKGYETLSAGYPRLWGVWLEK